MLDYYVGEIKSFAGTKVPTGWLLCDGATLNAEKHPILFMQLGNRYGGDGKTTFCVPDLRGRIPLGQSTVYPTGQKGGTESVKLMVEHLPAHSHNVSCSTSSSATSPDAAAAVWASTSKFGFGYNSAKPKLHLNEESIGMEGGDEAHENRMPYTTIAYIISEFGIYPPIS